jgi:hypothetical protein
MPIDYRREPFSIPTSAPRESASARAELSHLGSVLPRTWQRIYIEGAESVRDGAGYLGLLALNWKAF